MPAPSVVRNVAAFTLSAISLVVVCLAIARPLATATESGPSRESGNRKIADSNPIRELFQGERLDLWSLTAPESRGLPSVRAGDRVRTPVDRFIVSRLESVGIAPNPPADPATLIRRLSFDLLGLPPTADEVRAFVKECEAERTQRPAQQSRGNAYDRLVDRLLASPRYGERQARLWLDVVRYADTNGYERDEFRPLIWQYRDYVIRAFNDDKPFDQFIREQLAGDELVPSPPRDSAEADALIATGYLRLGQWDSTAAIFQEEDRLRSDMQADLVNTTASAFLGLTMGCCQCHDHKYDPFSQADHYRLRAFFAPLQPRDDLVVSTEAELAEIATHNAAIDGEALPLRESLAALLNGARERIRAQRREELSDDVRTLLDTEPATWDEKTKAELEPIVARLNVSDDDAKGTFDDADRAQFDELTQQVATCESKRRESRLACGATDLGESAPATFVLYQGDHTSPREEVPPGFVSVLSPEPAVCEPPREATSGRRLALARWIASAENPWTARVFVNRVWQQHFGVGLVATPNDFGYSGSPPTHPELLDWLAREFVRGGWSVKELHRIILKSATYRQSSRAPLEKSTSPRQHAIEQHDPGNSLYWRQNVRRLDAESLRDSLLSVAGLLRPYDSGRALWPEVPEELLHAQPAILEAQKGDDGGRMQGWYTDPVGETDVRSVFLVRKRCLPVPFLQAFDLPDSIVSCARRDTTVVAPQALLLLNSPEAVRTAQGVADRVREQASDDLRSLVETAFRVVLAREPDGEERELGLEALRGLIETRGVANEETGRLALIDFCRALLNLNEFAYVD